MVLSQHTYSPSPSDQNAGNPQDYTGNLQVQVAIQVLRLLQQISQYTLNPDMRANYTASAVTTSDRTGDNPHDLYDHTDLNGNNRALVTLSIQHCQMLLEQTTLLIGVIQVQMTHQQKMVAHLVQLVMLLLQLCWNRNRK